MYPDIAEARNARRRELYAQKHDKELIESLQFNYNGDASFIPLNTVITNVTVIAGKNGKIVFRHAADYAAKYSGNPEEWSKMTGKTRSDKYDFDIHWAEKDGQMFEP